MVVLARNGFSGLTLDRICAEAGVTKATFYRRWHSPVACVLEALVEVWSEAEFVDAGDPLRDLEAFAHKLIGLYTHPLLGRCMLAVQAERPVNPAVFDPVDAAGLQRRARNTATLARALERLPEPPCLPAETMLHALNGVARNIEGLRWPLADDKLRALIVTLLTPASRAGP
ncbi:MAG: helix-turn-helix transcriptional regulator [Caulobacterales bacterium]|nr:helix-turn-helix transcriptional regulator [Caulobacterales bacterium]